MNGLHNGTKVANPSEAEMLRKWSQTTIHSIVEMTREDSSKDLDVMDGSVMYRCAPFRQVT